MEDARLPVRSRGVDRLLVLGSDPAVVHVHGGRGGAVFERPPPLSPGSRLGFASCTSSGRSASSSCSASSCRRTARRSPTSRSSMCSRRSASAIRCCIWSARRPVVARTRASGSNCSARAVLVILVSYGVWFALYSTPDDELAASQTSLVAAQEDGSGLAQFIGFRRALEQAYERRRRRRSPAAQQVSARGRPRREAAILVQRRRLSNAEFHSVAGDDDLRIDGRHGVAERPDRRGKLRWLSDRGLRLFPASPCRSITTIWPCAVVEPGRRGSLCPAVKRIWTPTWAVFSGGWTLWILAAFYAVIDLWGWRRWAWPLAVVGVNSITMYCLSQLMRSFTKATLKTHLATVDQWANWDPGCVLLRVRRPVRLFADLWNAWPCCSYSGSPVCGCIGRRSSCGFDRRFAGIS